MKLSEYEKSKLAEIKEYYTIWSFKNVYLSSNNARDEMDMYLPEGTKINAFLKLRLMLLNSKTTFYRHRQMRNQL
jgi:hypothetical protein